MHGQQNIKISNYRFTPFCTGIYKESSDNREKLVSASSYLYVRQPVTAQRPLNGLVSFMEICRENPYLFQIEQKYRALYDLSTFCCYRRHKFATKAFLSNA